MMTALTEHGITPALVLGCFPDDRILVKGWPLGGVGAPLNMQGKADIAVLPPRNEIAQQQEELFTSFRK